jgi:TolB protein
MVCVMPRTQGNRGSDIVFIDHQVEGINRLVSDGLQNMSPVLSPDGTQLAYTSYRDGAPNIFLRDLKSGREQPLTTGPWLALPGAWSPDGRYLALSQSLEGNNDIFLYDLQRQRLRRLTTHPGIDVSPSFAPDSKRLVFASDRTGSPQLYLTDLTGKTPVRLTQTGPYNTSPAWSPHNDTIAFIGRSANQALDLYLIQADGTKLQRLTEGQHFHAPPTWSPAGNVLMGMSLHGSSWEQHLVHISDKPNTHRLPQEGPLCLAPQWVAHRVP